MAAAAAVAEPMGLDVDGGETVTLTAKDGTSVTLAKRQVKISQLISTTLDSGAWSGWLGWLLLLCVCVGLLVCNDRGVCVCVFMWWCGFCIWTCRARACVLPARSSCIRFHLVHVCAHCVFVRVSAQTPALHRFP